MRWAENEARNGGWRGAHRVFVGKRERKKHRGRPRLRWGNITMKPQEVGWVGMDCTDLAQDMDRCRALVIAVMNLWVPSNAGNFLTS
jgi:hypothetical protein